MIALFYTSNAGIAVYRPTDLGREIFAMYDAIRALGGKLDGGQSAYWPAPGVVGIVITTKGNPYLVARAMGIALGAEVEPRRVDDVEALMEREESRLTRSGWKLIEPLALPAGKESGRPVVKAYN